MRRSSPARTAAAVMTAGAALALPAVPSSAQAQGWSHTATCDRLQVTLVDDQAGQVDHEDVRFVGFDGPEQHMSGHHYFDDGRLEVFRDVLAGDSGHVTYEPPATVDVPPLDLQVTIPTGCPEFSEPSLSFDTDTPGWLDVSWPAPDAGTDVPFTDARLSVRAQDPSGSADGPFAKWAGAARDVAFDPDGSGTAEVEMYTSGPVTVSLQLDNGSGSTQLTGDVTVPDLPAPTGRPDVVRLGGADRYATSAEIFDFAVGAHSLMIWPTIASGANFPDAMAVTSQRGVNLPLLTDPQRLPAATREALVSHHPLMPDDVTSAMVAGGQAAVSDAVVDELAGMLSRQPDRVAGADRYVTAAALSGFGPGDVDVDGDGRPEREVWVLASGEQFPDALAASNLTAGLGLRLLLTERDELPEVSARALSGEGGLLVVGGPAAVSDEVVASARRRLADGAPVLRLSGPTRQHTAEQVASWAASRRDELASKTVVLARPDDYPDALSASGLVAYHGATLLLTGSTSELGPQARRWLTERACDVRRVVAVGGTSALSDGVLFAAAEAATCR